MRVVLRLGTAVLIPALAAGAACTRDAAPGARPADAAPVAAQPPGQTPTVAQQAPARPVPAELPAVVARVNGEAIARGEFEQALRAIETRAGGPVPGERRDEILRDVLDQLVAYRLLTQEGQTRKVTVSDAEVDARLAEIRNQFPTEQAFAQLLAERNLSVAALREQARTDMLVTRVIDQEIAGKIAVQPDEVSDFYDQNRERFKEGEAVRASHILFAVEPTATPDAKRQARGQAEAVLKQVTGDADFAALARKHSKDSGTAPSGGDLGFFSRGQMVPAFETAAFALEPGQMSGVVESRFGYHIIKVLEKRPARDVPLAEVSTRIGEFLTTQQQQQQTAAFIAALKAKSRIDIFI